MARARKRMHLSALGLFGVATVFYLLGAITPVIVLSLIGMVVEIAAWLTLFGHSSNRDNANGSGTDAT